jgi:Holliday junction resolvase RusA-like endonuclease
MERVCANKATVSDRRIYLAGRHDGLVNMNGPTSDEIVVSVPLPPVRFKASRARKDALTQQIKARTSKEQYLLTGEVKVDIEWLIHERDRHESPRSPDIDNILKPILDALQGPDGIMVNDAQVQEICCRWIDWTRREQRLDLRIHYLEDEWIEKDGLIFVRMTPTLCMPHNRTLPADGALVILEAWERQFAARAELLALTADYHAANRVMPVQRPFHISRVRAFATVTLEQICTDLRDELRSVGSV